MLQDLAEIDPFQRRDSVVVRRDDGAFSVELAHGGSMTSPPSPNTAPGAAALSVLDTSSGRRSSHRGLAARAILLATLTAPARRGRGRPVLERGQDALDPGNAARSSPPMPTLEEPCPAAIPRSTGPAYHTEAERPGRRDLAATFGTPSMRATLDCFRERADRTGSAALLLARTEGRETSPFEPWGDEPPQRAVPGG